MAQDTIYNLHDKAFLHVSAFVVMSGDNRVATIAFKFPKDGAGRLWVYVHWIGSEMVRGYAGGYGYDKKSAAVENAVAKLKNPYDPNDKGTIRDMEWTTFVNSLRDIGGSTWNDRLRQANFTVLQAV